MKIFFDGKWIKNVHVTSAATGFRAKRIRLNESDLADLANMSDRDLVATVRQLSARVNRAAPYPYQRDIMARLLGQKGFHTGGFVNNPTGRYRAGPEVQFLPSGTRTGRWSSECPAKSQVPRHGLAELDFSELEKRLYAQMGVDFETLAGSREKDKAKWFTISPKQFGKSQAQYRENFGAYWSDCARREIQSAMARALEDVKTEDEARGRDPATPARKKQK